MKIKNQKKTLLTGFGLFANLDFNISGAIVENYALQNQIFSKNEFKDLDLKKGILIQSDNGKRIYDCEVVIQKEIFLVRCLLLDVVWEQSGIEVIRQMELFQPDLVLMLGRGNSDVDVIFEMGALNKKNSHPGYSCEGVILEQPQCTTGEIIKDGPPKLMMNWNAKDLAHLIKSNLQEMGLQCFVAETARSENTYICNNISYMALAANQKGNFTLSESNKELKVKINSDPKIGFLHLPTSLKLEKEKIFGWIKNINTIIYECLK